MEDFADWLRAARGKRPQAHLAAAARIRDEEAACSPTRISEWENRHALPSLRQLSVLLLELNPTQSEAERAWALWERAQLEGLPIDLIPGRNRHEPSEDSEPVRLQDGVSVA